MFSPISSAFVNVEGETFANQCLWEKGEMEETYLRCRGGADTLCGRGYYGAGGISGGHPCAPVILPGEGGLHSVPAQHLPSGASGAHQPDLSCPCLWLQASPSALGLPAFCPSYRKNFFFFHDYQSNTHHFGQIGRHRKILRNAKPQISYNPITQFTFHTFKCFFLLVIFFSSS